MNRKNNGNSSQAKVLPNPGESILWSRVDPEEWAGGLISPSFPGDCGFDLCASRTVTIAPKGWAQVPTNIRISLPHGYWGMIVSRSSTFFKRQLLAQTAVIDQGYTGPIWSMLYNLSDKPVTVRRKERLTQLILMQIHTPATIEVSELPESARGDKGFGSTGITVEEADV